MKMITKYQLFEKLNSRGSKSLTEKEFDQILKENCKNWPRAKTSLYRGQIDLGPYVYVDPRGTYRKSIDDFNTHIEMMDNLSAWKDYPKYSSSIIGVSKYVDIAENYGRVYEMIPFDNIDIAVCPRPTIWDSFGGFGDDGVIYMTHGFLESQGINADVWLQPGGGTIESQLKSMKSLVIEKKPSGGTKEFLLQASEYFNKTQGKLSPAECFEFIEYLFSPMGSVYGGRDESDEFSIIKYSPGFSLNRLIAPDMPKQIWTEGPVLLIYSELS